MIDLPGLTHTSGGSAQLDASVHNRLDVVEGADTVEIQLDPTQDFAGNNFTPSPDQGTATELTFVACFAAGTRILTASGEVPVEALRIGDHVATLHGHRLTPIVWLGYRHIDCLRHPSPTDVWPVRVEAGAIANGVPHRVLLLSPEHAVLLHHDATSVLVPIRHLLNGTTIAQVPVPSITYWHVELASHDAIIAEGLAAESYLDTGNRADFANGGPAVTVHPTFADLVCAQTGLRAATSAMARHFLVLKSRSTRRGKDARGSALAARELARRRVRQKAEGLWKPDSR